MARKAKNSQLKKQAHKGRPASTGAPTTNVLAQNGRGVRATGLRRGDPRLTAAAMTQMSPTPHGPEPNWPS